VRFVTDTLLTVEFVRARGIQAVLLRGKIPVGEHWQIETEAATVASWLRAESNVGLVCGERSGVAVLDPDRPLEWADMVDTLGQPSDPWVETGSGKLHYYVAWEPDLPAKLTWQGETIGEIQRGPGLQQVVMPPSVHPDSGRRYRWLVNPATEPLPTLPPTWRDYLGSSSSSRLGSPTVVDPAAVADRYAAALQQPGARRRVSGEVKFACPACRAGGWDKPMDNARLFRNGSWGCAVHPRGTPESLTHWRAPNHPHEDAGDAFAYLIAGMAPSRPQKSTPSVAKNVPNWNSAGLKLWPRR
jgi:Bifunctional DNA primase/polymerase, N-terminal